MAESLKFSRGDKQQETTHLHFQRPALSASPPPGRLRSKTLPSGTIAAGGVGGRGGSRGGGPNRLSQAPSPLLPSTHLQPLEAVPLASKCRDPATAKASNPKWDKRRDPPLRLGYQRAGGGRGGSPEAQWAVKGGLGSLMGFWLLLFRGRTAGTGARARPRAPVGLGSLGLLRRSGSSTRLLQRLALPGLRSSRDGHCPSRTLSPGVGVGKASAGIQVFDAPRRSKGPRDPSPGSRVRCLAGS